MGADRPMTAARLDALEGELAVSRGESIVLPGRTLTEALIAAAREALRLRGLVDAHNAGCVLACEARNTAPEGMAETLGVDWQSPICAQYAGRKRGCPTCPRRDMIDADAAQAEGAKKCR